MNIFDKYIPYESIVPFFVGINDEVKLLCHAWCKISVNKPIIFLENKSPIVFHAKVKTIPESVDHRILLQSIVDYAEDYNTERKIVLLIYAEKSEEQKLEGYSATLERNVVLFTKQQFAELINKN